MKIYSFCGVKESSSTHNMVVIKLALFDERTDARTAAKRVEEIANSLYNLGDTESNRTIQKDVP